MRISDWSSDVCSSDLAQPRRMRVTHKLGRYPPVHHHRLVGADPPGISGDRLQPRRGRHRGIARHRAVGRPAFPVEQLDEANRRQRVQRLQIVDLERLDEDRRSEEHTSELQSLMRISYAVFCLKKKTKTQT